MGAVPASCLVSARTAGKTGGNGPSEQERATARGTDRPASHLVPVSCTAPCDTMTCGCPDASLAASWAGDGAEAIPLPPPFGAAAAKPILRAKALRQSRAGRSGNRYGGMGGGERAPVSPGGRSWPAIKTLPDSALRSPGRREVSRAGRDRTAPSGHSVSDARRDRRHHRAALPRHHPSVRRQSASAARGRGALLRRTSSAADGPTAASRRRSS